MVNDGENHDEGAGSEHYSASLLAMALAFVAIAVPTAAQQAGGRAVSRRRASTIRCRVLAGAGKVLIFDTSVLGWHQQHRVAGSASARLGRRRRHRRHVGVDEHGAVRRPTRRSSSVTRRAATSLLGRRPAPTPRTWAPGRDGNVITNGTDPVFHESVEPGCPRADAEVGRLRRGATRARPGSTSPSAAGVPASGTPVDILNAISPVGRPARRAVVTASRSSRPAAILVGPDQRRARGLGLLGPRLLRDVAGRLRRDRDRHRRLDLVYTAPDGTTGIAVHPRSGFRPHRR